MVFLTMILTLMLCFLVRPISSYLVQPFLLTSIPLCMFCSIVTCNMHCKQQQLSRLAYFALRTNVVINIVYIKKSITTTSLGDPYFLFLNFDQEDKTESKFVFQDHTDFQK